MTNQLNLRSIDIPQIHRFGVGFDRMFRELDQMLTNTAGQSNYPPYNMIKHTEDKFSIEIAVAGFRDGEVTIEVANQQLKVEGRQAQVIEDEGREYIHRGISGRDFVRVFTLAEHVEVVGARQENGILTITLERQVPEEKKPKAIAISYVK
jgi:molecular chaperone IbpA